MRGFGAVQACFAHEAQMDRLAAALDIDPVELRLLNALGPGDRIATGQRVESSLPVAEVIRRCAALEPPPPEELPREAIRLPGGAGNTTRGEGVRRGTGFAVGFKNICYSEGFDDSCAAGVRLLVDAGGAPAAAVVRCAAAEVGQGVTDVILRVARRELGLDAVSLAPPSTAAVSSAGSTSASRQTTMTGGAVLAACREIADELGGGPLEEPVTRTCVHHHRPTTGLDADGHGDVHVSFAFVAERAVVEVDAELGLVRVVQLAVAQDAGRVLNPQGAEGQVEGGVAMGLGLALTEELRVEGGTIRNASFTDYLIPTVLDVPPIVTEFVEVPEPGAPYGLKGIGELGAVAATPAIVAALRAATGRTLNRVPVRPDDLVGLRPPAASAGPSPVPDVPAQIPIPERLGLGLGQQRLMKART
jgi:CO/xanthine dehydrogenase Mo-binding subunit